MVQPAVAQSNVLLLWQRQKDVRLLLKAVHCQVWMVKRVQYGPFFLKGIPEVCVGGAPPPGPLAIFDAKHRVFF